MSYRTVCIRNGVLQGGKGGERRLSQQKASPRQLCPYMACGYREGGERQGLIYETQRPGLPPPSPPRLHVLAGQLEAGGGCIFRSGFISTNSPRKGQHRPPTHTHTHTHKTNTKKSFQHCITNEHSSVHTLHYFMLMMYKLIVSAL
jgi:hypothetical protein